MAIDMGPRDGARPPQLLQASRFRRWFCNGESDPLVEPGERDANSPRRSADRKVIIYPHVGHLPQIEIPQRSAADVAAFLQAAAPRR